MCKRGVGSFSKAARCGSVIRSEGTRAALRSQLTLLSEVANIKLYNGAVLAGVNTLEGVFLSAYNRVCMYVLSASYQIPESELFRRAASMKLKKNGWGTGGGRTAQLQLGCLMRVKQRHCSRYIVPLPKRVVRLSSHAESA